MKNYSHGFTLIELLIAIAIVGILTAVAVPSYQKYTRKARYTEIIQAALPFKLGIEECYQLNEDLKNCQPGKNGVPKNVATGTGIGLVDSITIDDKSAIIITPRTLYGIKATDNYILKPVPKNGQLTWETDGGGKKEGYIN